MPPPLKSLCSLLIAASQNAARWQFCNEFDKSCGKRGGSEVWRSEKKGWRVGVKTKKMVRLNCKDWISILFSFREIPSILPSMSAGALASTSTVKSSAVPSYMRHLVFMYSLLFPTALNTSLLYPTLLYDIPWPEGLAMPSVSRCNL